MAPRSKTLRCSPLQRPMFRHRIVTGCNSSAEIPVDFISSHMPGDHEGKFISLTTDYSTRRWNVKMVNNHFTDGWEDFVHAHHLRTGDTVIFRKDRGLVFHVYCFGPDVCLIKYNQHGENQNTVRIENSSEDESPPMHIFQQTVTAANLKANQVYVPSDFSNLNGLMNKNMEILLMNHQGTVWGAILKQCKDRRQKIVGGWTEFCTETNLSVGDVCSFRFIRQFDIVTFQLFWVNDALGNPKRLL